MNTTNEIRRQIAEIPAGEPFLVTRFLALGPRASVDQAISRLVKQAQILRVARGVYVRPKPSRLFGQQWPSTEQILQTVAATHGEIIEISGAEAERRFGLTTQTAMTPVYLTSGPTRTLRIGQLAVELRHACARKLALAGTPQGWALLALLSRGKKQVGAREIELVRSQLPPQAFDALAAAHAVLPGWLAQALNQHEAHHG